MQQASQLVTQHACFTLQAWARHRASRQKPAADHVHQLHLVRSLNASQTARCCYTDNQCGKPSKLLRHASACSPDLGSAGWVRG